MHVHWVNIGGFTGKLQVHRLELATSTYINARTVAKTKATEGTTCQIYLQMQVQWLKLVRSNRKKRNNKLPSNLYVCTCITGNKHTQTHTRSLEIARELS